VRAGPLSPPFRASGRFSPSRDRAGWLAPIVDLSCHHLDLMHALVGAPPTSVVAEQSRLVADWADGSRLEGIYEVAPPVDTVELRSSGGSVVVNRLRGMRLRGRHGGLPIPALLRAHAFGGTWERSFEYALAAFVAAAREGSAAEPGVESGIAAVAVAEAIFRSRASGEREAVELHTELAA